MPMMSLSSATVNKSVSREWVIASSRPPDERPNFPVPRRSVYCIWLLAVLHLPDPELTRKYSRRLLLFLLLYIIGTLCYSQV